MSAAKVFGDRWRVIAPFREGGQGWLYRVEDQTRQYPDPVLLKRLKNTDRIDRFQKEIEAAQRLDHPLIPKVIDYSLDDPAYFVTPCLEGSNLEEVVPLSLLRALRIFRQLCEVVAYAHSAGVVHRDLKPENILLGANDQPAILDFGLCYFQDDNARLTQTMEQVGSRFYMAPELEGGRSSEVSEKVDSYALGKILYFLLTGRHIARENFTDENDLSEVLKNPQAAYVTKKVLKASIHNDPKARGSAEELACLAAEAHRLINEHFYPGTEGSVCRFCGEGRYKKAYKADLTASTLKYRNEQIPLDFLACDTCAHVAWFLRKT